MEIEKTGRFVTDFYGSQPAVGATKVLENWTKGNVNKAFLSWGDQIKKKGQDAIDAIANVLSIFNRGPVKPPTNQPLISKFEPNGEDMGDCPILGNWMLQKCLVNTGKAIFNAKKDPLHPSKASIGLGITLIEPINIPLYREDGIIIKADEVKTYAVTAKISFFKAYEVIKLGAMFSVKIHFDEDALTKDHINLILSKCGFMGLGAYRQRFGKFEWIN